MAAIAFTSYNCEGERSEWREALGTMQARSECCGRVCCYFICIAWEFERGTQGWNELPGRRSMGLGLWRMNTISCGGELKLRAWSKFVIRLPLGYEVMGSRKGAGVW